MSLDNLSIDFSRLSFDLPNGHNNDRLVAQQQPPKIHPGPTPRAKSRNRQCIPSDDEDEEEEEDKEDEDRDDSDEGREPRALRSNNKPALKSTTGRKVKKQLPSDDEDSDQDENERRDGRAKHYNNEEVGYYNNYEGAAANVMYGYEQGYNPMQQQQQYYEDDDDDDRALVPNPNAGPVLTLVEGSHLQQLQKKQQQHQAQLAQFQYLQQLHPNQHNNKYHHQKPLHQQQNKSMSGMDLLKQLEQEKADLKRVKPKLDTSKVKIEGLLGNIPEPGSHNISFQQLQQQQKRMHKNTNSRPASTLAVGGYLDPHSHHHHSNRSKSPSRSPSPHRRSPSPSFAAGTSHYRNSSSSYINK